MKQIFFLLLLTFLFTYTKADSPRMILGATVTNSGDIDPYTVTDALATSYMWTVSEGSIVSGQGTPNITIHWDSNLPGSVGVNIDNGSEIVIIDTNSNKN